MKGTFEIFRTSVLSGLLSSTLVHAQIQLPAIISDHMVVQAGHTVRLWGKASVGAAITARFKGKTMSTHADAAGYWSLELPPIAASNHPEELTIAEKTAAGSINMVMIRDVLAGEVWLAGGQSNMAYGLEAMQGKEKYIAAAANPQLRLFQVKHNTSAEPLGLRPGLLQGDVDGKWELADSRTAAPSLRSRTSSL